MPLREFTDGEGTSWRVWDVHPKLDVVPDQGFGVERRVADVPYLSFERRRTPRPPPAGTPGWLVFDCEAEKRRLSPIPENWESCTDEELLRYWQRSQPAR